MPSVNENYQLVNRRYIGSKAKLVQWIVGIMQQHCADARILCDIFAGTAAVASAAIPRYDKVIINDFLMANQVIYNAFFADEDFNSTMLKNVVKNFNRMGINPGNLSDNYFSESFGGKFFEPNVAKFIGWVRQEIETLRPMLTNKEYCILLSSLIYSIDRIANTVGHYDAYFKNKKFNFVPLEIRLVDAKRCHNVEIMYGDANVVAKNIEADIVYLDPPYNSRQYNSAYHLYENLVQWQKPVVHGVAAKPKDMSETRSQYCTNQAPMVMRELVENLNCRYILLSYNSTAQKANGRSNAKIDDDTIMEILSAKGEVQIFSQSHQLFNAGKTSINNNQERLFLCVCNNC